MRWFVLAIAAVFGLALVASGVFHFVDDASRTRSWRTADAEVVGSWVPEPAPGGAKSRNPLAPPEPVVRFTDETGRVVEVRAIDRDARPDAPERRTVRVRWAPGRSSAAEVVPPPGRARTEAGWLVFLGLAFLVGGAVGFRLLSRPPTDEPTQDPFA